MLLLRSARRRAVLLPSPLPFVSHLSPWPTAVPPLSLPRRAPPPPPPLHPPPAPFQERREHAPHFTAPPAPRPPSLLPPPAPSLRLRLAALLPDAPPGAGNAGWTRREVLNAPNALSLCRALSGPPIAYLVLSDRPAAALALLAAAAASDAADGALARRIGLVTPLGSYLDPLADKLAFGCLAVAVAAKGLIPLSLVGIIIARDVALVGGSVVARARAVRAAAAAPQPNGANSTTPRSDIGFFDLAGEGAAPRVAPLAVSKLNTAATAVLLAAALSAEAWGAPSEGAIAAGCAFVGATTVASGAAYARLFARGATSAGAARA